MKYIKAIIFVVDLAVCIADAAMCISTIRRRRKEEDLYNKKEDHKKVHLVNGE